MSRKVPWQQIRQQVLSRDSHSCQTCNSTEQLTVHHLTYENYGDEPLEDLVTLCWPCHKKAHHKNPSLASQSPRRTPKQPKPPKPKKLTGSTNRNVPTAMPPQDLQHADPLHTARSKGSRSANSANRKQRY